MKTDKNATKVIAVEVKESHIKRGEKGIPESCAIALAVRSLRFKHVRVDSTYIDMSKGKIRYTASLPKRAQNFIERFDDGKKVKPFTFKAKLVPDAQ